MLSEQRTNNEVLSKTFTKWFINLTYIQIFMFIISITKYYIGCNFM